MDMFLKSIVYKYNIKEFLLYRILCSMGTFFVSILMFFSVGLYKKNFVGIILKYLSACKSLLALVGGII